MENKTLTISLFSACYYILVAFGLNVSNSWVFKEGFNYPSLLIVGQLTLLTLLYLFTSLLGFYFAVSRQRIYFSKRHLLLVLFFFAMNLSNMTSLATLKDIVFFIEMRRTTCFFILTLQWILYRNRPTLCVFLAVLTIVFGASYSLLFRTIPISIKGFLLSISGNVFSALYLLWVPHVSEQGKYNSMELTLSLSVLSLPLMIGLSFLSGEITGFTNFIQQKLTVSLAVSFSISCLLGCFISHATFVNSINNSPLTHSISGHMKDMLMLFLGSYMGIGSFPTTPIERIGLAINLFGGFLYVYGKYQETRVQSCHSSSHEKVDGKEKLVKPGIYTVDGKMN